MTSKERTISYFQLKLQVIAKIAQLYAVDFNKIMLENMILVVSYHLCNQQPYIYSPYV